MINHDSDHFGVQKLPPVTIPNAEPMREADKATMLSTSPALSGLAQVAYGNKSSSGIGNSTVNGAFQSESTGLDDSEDDNKSLNNRALRRVPSNPSNEGSFLWSLNILG